MSGNRKGYTSDTGRIKDSSMACYPKLTMANIFVFDGHLKPDVTYFLEDEAKQFERRDDTHCTHEAAIYMTLIVWLCQPLPY